MLVNVVFPMREVRGRPWLLRKHPEIDTCHLVLGEDPGATWCLSINKYAEWGIHENPCIFRHEAGLQGADEWNVRPIPPRARISLISRMFSPSVVSIQWGDLVFLMDDGGEEGQQEPQANGTSHLRRERRRSHHQRMRRRMWQCRVQVPTPEAWE